MKANRRQQGKWRATERKKNDETKPKRAKDPRSETGSNDFKIKNPNDWAAFRLHTVSSVMIPWRTCLYQWICLCVVVNSFQTPNSWRSYRGATISKNTGSSILIQESVAEHHEQFIELPPQHTKRRPSMQQVTKSRVARRMNHGFRHLYRHTATDGMNQDPVEYLRMEGNFTTEQIVQMNDSFPILLELSVSRQLRPKMLFLKQTLQVPNPSSVFDSLPPQYFGARLERTLAPRHAFLVWMGLPSGIELFRRKSDSGELLFVSFMRSGRNSKQFAAMCQSWRRVYVPETPSPLPGAVTSKHVEAFELLFSRGLLSAARNELGETKWAAAVLPMLTPANVTSLLIQHGANPVERDHRGATLLHWACGSGNWEVAKVLLPFLSVWDNQSRDSSTPLHWAAAGTTAREFGVGGHVNVCRSLLAAAAESGSLQEYVNCLTKDGNSALMWAAWSGTLDTVKLLARHRSDSTIANLNGCTVAHWAASGGNLDVCKYLADTVKVDFSLPNHGGNTPLSHAVAFGRNKVVEWLLNDASIQRIDREDEVMALSLAQDFVQWTNGDDDARTKVLDLFQESGFIADL